MQATFAVVMPLPRWWHNDVERGEHSEGFVPEPTTHGTNNLVSAKIPKKITCYMLQDVNNCTLKIGKEHIFYDVNRSRHKCAWTDKLRGPETNFSEN
jgi:hypothetical protein